jgi:hypothetical protein
MVIAVFLLFLRHGGALRMEGYIVESKGLIWTQKIPKGAEALASKER